MRDPEICNAIAGGAAKGIAKVLLAVASVLMVLLLAADLAGLMAQGAPTDLTVRATAYSWREPAHKKWGARNAIGGSLARQIGRAHV